jgi:hypothetical protein
LVLVSLSHVSKINLWLQHYDPSNLHKSKFTAIGSVAAAAVVVVMFVTDCGNYGLDFLKCHSSCHVLECSYATESVDVDSKHIHNKF